MYIWAVLDPCHVLLSVRCRGMDPIAFAVLCGLGSGVVGYMVGGALFNGTWRLLARTKAKQLQEVRLFEFVIGC